MEDPVIVACLAAFRNRRERTLSFVSSIFASELPTGVVLDLTLFDDGSSDGTSSAVLERFPSVTILTGSGDAYWNGAMSILFDRTLSRNGVDAVLMANDDISVRQGALKEALELFRSLNASGVPTALVGAFQHDGSTTYSGFLRRQRRGPGALVMVEPSSSVETCDTFNGNFVILPASACRAVGGLDRGFKHSGGDIDLGYRLKASGVRIVLAPGYIGECEKGPTLAERVRHLSIPKRIQLVLSPLRSPGDVARLAVKHGGVLAPLVIAKDILMRIRLILLGR